MRVSLAALLSNLTRPGKPSVAAGDQTGKITTFCQIIIFFFPDFILVKEFPFFVFQFFLHISTLSEST